MSWKRRRKGTTVRLRGSPGRARAPGSRSIRELQPRPHRVASLAGRARETRPARRSSVPRVCPLEGVGAGTAGAIARGGGLLDCMTSGVLRTVVLSLESPLTPPPLWPGSGCDPDGSNFLHADPAPPQPPLPSLLPTRKCRTRSVSDYRPHPYPADCPPSHCPPVRTLPPTPTTKEAEGPLNQIWA